jgi:putative nucleotidyltransferase with HDIG domain
MFLAPTFVPDQAATLQKQREAARHVIPVTNVIYPGEYVVRRGDLVTPAVTEKLAALGIHPGQTGWQDVLGSLLLSAVVVTILFWYLFAFHPAVMANVRLLVLIDASILVTVGAARLLTPDHILLPYFLPVAAASTFAAVLMAPEASVALALSIAILTGWVVANSFELTVYYVVTGMAGILAVRQIRRLKQFVLAGVYIALCGLAAALAFGLIDHNYDVAALQEYVLAAAFNGFVSSTLALGAFALLSDFFGVTTMLQILELSQPSQPLLRRLMVKAPGTYNHSLIVASMVERAAEEVGANSLVAKVGALYHDVGKTTNPHCFVENQLGVGNVHDELWPEESARIIRGHVSQGLRLARQFKLPPMVLEAIAEHHGTMTMAYFLHRARQGSGPDGLRRGEIDLSLYAYPGPKPQSKETALLMLADGCESAVRASSDHAQEKIEETVRRIFEERIQQGQLDECPLTLQDLESARKTFCSVLNGLYHPRIEYPEGVEPVVDSASRFVDQSQSQRREGA